MQSTARKVICTIIAKNYIAFARTLCRSFRDHYPDGIMYVLIVDDWTGYVDPAEEPFIIIRLEDLDIPNLREFCFKYNVTELSTASKPYLLDYLFRKINIDKLLYLDPDILITNDLDPLFHQLEANDILVTPHLDKDYPDDGQLPNDAHIMKSGIFNLGFIGLRNTETVGQFLAWWKNKLYDKCTIDHAAGYFVDQRFVDLAFTLFKNLTIVYDPGYNVAYWNIHSRSIRLVGNTWMCNESKLRFYHFSNYRVEKPQSISGHQTRFSLSDLPDLNRLFSHYRDLLQRNGYERSQVWPYTYGRFTNGRPIHDSFRMLYRRFGRRMNVRDPFDIRCYSVQFRLMHATYRCFERMKHHGIALLRYWHS